MDTAVLQQIQLWTPQKSLVNSICKFIFGLRTTGLFIIVNLSSNDSSLFRDVLYRTTLYRISVDTATQWEINLYCMPFLWA